MRSVLRNGKSQVYSIGSKTKMAPIAKLRRAAKDKEDFTILRLELMASLSLVGLAEKVAFN